MIILAKKETKLQTVANFNKDFNKESQTSKQLFNEAQAGAAQMWRSSGGAHGWRYTQMIGFDIEVAPQASPSEFDIEAAPSVKLTLINGGHAEQYARVVDGAASSKHEEKQKLLMEEAGYLDAKLLDARDRVQ